MDGVAVDWVDFGAKWTTGGTLGVDLVVVVVVEVDFD